MRLIDADKLSEDIDQAQELLMTNDDKMWRINKSYFKGLAWARGLINESPTINPYEWISVEDGLPEDNSRYLVYIPCKYYFPLLTVAYYSLTKNSWIGVEGGTYYYDHPTHYMPIPELPTEKEN